MEDKKIIHSAPELRPTREEFEHPIKYLSSPKIEELGEKYGILKVIPPEGWRPNFSLSWDEFKFHTRIQRLHELNLRNRSRACFVEGFNCYLESKGLEPLPTIENLCLGVSDSYKMSDIDLNDHLNGWIKLKNGKNIHIHDIFLSREFRKWFYRIDEGEREILKELSTYSRFLLSVLKLEGVEDDIYNEEGGLVIPPEITHTILRELLKSPAALLKQPDNKLKLQKMRKRLMTSMRKRGGKMSKKVKVESMLTPPMESKDEFPDLLIDKVIDLPLTPDILAPEELEEACTICYRKDSPNSTLICDGCERVYHMRCLPIPLDRVPKYSWFCGGCLAGITNSFSEYGFEEEFDKMFSLREFQEYSRKWESELIKMIKNGEILNNGLKLSGEEVVTNKLSEETIEELFWSFTNGESYIPEESMKIRYGADIHNEKPGEVSGFPTYDNPRRKTEDDEYINCEWNLNKLPFARGSLLEYICKSLNDEDENEIMNEDEVKNKNQISGMTVPWVYIGGPMSTFCWHKEDHYTLSANYSHLGAPKKWYGIPAHDSFKFEEIINKIAPEYEAKQKDLMHQLVSMVSPDEVRHKSDGEVRIFETVQHAGEFIITFPKVYHSGFNFGFNVNEAVNFTLPLWIPFSIPAIKEYEKVGKECVFDTFKLLKKIYYDLNSAEGRFKWKNDTGISDEKIDELIKWVNKVYIEEVNDFERIVKDKDVIRLIKGMKNVSVKEFNEEINGVNEDEEEEKEEEEDRLCMDCKTRVHFKWVVIDMYEDWIREYESENRRGKVKGLTGLGIKYKDMESEWQSIIEKAKEESLKDGESVKIRRSSRKRKFNDAVEEVIKEEEDEGGIESNSKKDKYGKGLGSKEMYASMRALRIENCHFGKCVFCLRCLKEEGRKLSRSEVSRIRAAGRVVYE
ncbi:hypothetical protein CANINC_003976 [Pichia inconspicua]|uniref:[Histone H3]-trimethyl-L-lysine(4) demethylase n=1 Tax=Pichia inconspicua TaxID=52247 RepID=A0A4T0WXN0_9ASCO|nr:hypothetical protein CANINC_003976 [[Candida] inconspicua]